ncbi:MAG: hypothetical protein U0638_01690 [Phycisphaerales bacterium]
MPSTIINQTPHRFGSGGFIEISDGTNTYEFKNLVYDSVKYKPPYKEVIEYTDRGTQLAPLEGDDTLGELEFTARATRDMTSNVRTWWNDRHATDNTIKEYTGNIKIPDRAGATTGVVYALTGLHFSEPVDFSTGQQFDLIRIKMKVRGASDPAPY